MVGDDRLWGGFVLKDESFLILLSCILRIKHHNLFYLNFNNSSSEKIIFLHYLSIQIYRGIHLHQTDYCFYWLKTYEFFTLITFKWKVAKIISISCILIVRLFILRFWVFNKLWMITIKIKLNLKLFYISRIGIKSKIQIYNDILKYKRKKLQSTSMVRIGIFSHFYINKIKIKRISSCVWLK